LITYQDKNYICALDLGFEQIRGKWKAVILCHLDEGPKRFLVLQRLTGDISQKVLNQSLKEMEEEGLIHKQVFPETPPRVEYSLTTKGKGLIPALRIIEAWAKRNYAELVDPVVPN
jgi:DNA-binding HxlR family transcriptional regulator